MSSDDISNDISELRTRKQYIDPELEKRGWLEKYIKAEVNSVKSDFVGKHFVFYDGHPEKGVDRFIDYVLLDEDLSVLAIIEAKRFSKNEDNGRIQARTYSKDIENQLGKKIPIFLTNGHKWRFIDENGIERRVSGPFSQEDLRRRSNLFSNSRDLKSVKHNSRIVDRPKSVRIVSELCDHFGDLHRKALVSMATGTGKTRVAMALIDCFINANMVRNVLFVADRVALVNQAKSSGYQQFFTEPIVDLRDGFSTTGRLFVSTVQTLMSGSPDRLVDRLSPGFFDLIIFDEAHRSYYDRNNYVMEYFDAIQIGLTATPRDQESRSTFELFDCDIGRPTVEYSYDEAVLDNVLVPYRAHIVGTEILSLGIKGRELDEHLKDDLRRQELDPNEAEFTGSQFDRVFMDDKTNELIVREFLQECYKSDDGKPCKSIVFCASKRHARHMKDIFGKVAPNLSDDVQVIVSGMGRAEDEVRRFQNESNPRIALSVGMLDTGVDIPEVCNLVLVKPVFSSIRFWQMIGRGTRNQNSCKHPEWLSNREKHDFLIFDFEVGGHSNIHYHELSVSKETLPTKDTVSRIFENRVKLLQKSLNDTQKELIIEKILESLNLLDEESFVVREKLPVLYKIKDNTSDIQSFIKELLDEITPLMIFNKGINVNVSSFIVRVERLFNCILERNFDKIAELQVYVKEMCENILQKDNLTDIRDNRELILKVFQDDFWDDLTFSNVEFLVTDIAPLMKYYEPNPRKIIQIDAPDIILSRTEYVKEIEEDEELQQFLDENPLIKKIKDGEGITSQELMELEVQLSALKPGMTVDAIQRIKNIDFLEFLSDIIGLTREYDPKEMIEKRFDEFIIEKSDYSTDQIEFLILLKKVFADRKHIDITDFGKPPLSLEHPLEYFRIEELREIVKKVNLIKMK